MELTLQELLDAVTGVGADAPATARVEAVTGLLTERGADAETFLNEALESYDSIRKGDDQGDETVAALSALIDVVDGARARQTQLSEAAAKRAEELEALDARLRPADGGGDGDDQGDEGGEDGTGETDGGGEGGTGDGGDGGTDGDDGDAAPGDAADSGAGQATESAAVTASGRRTPRVNLGALRRSGRTAPVEQQGSPRAVITAAADVPGIPTGSPLDLDGLTKATIAQMSTFPTERIPGARMRAGIARIKIPFADKKLIADDSHRDQDVFDYAGNTRRTQNGKSLVAAGGWCSPSQTLYDLCPGLESATAGLLDIPEIQITRGGINATEGPDIAAVFSSIGFKQTEAQAIAGTAKPSYRVPCPAFTETRAGVTGINIISGILNDDAYPEMTRRIVELAMAVHQHKVNLDTIAAIVAGSTDLGTVNAGISATTSVLNVIEMQVVDIRYRYRADENLLLELPIPIFMKAVIRADISLRTGIPFENVSDQVISGWFNQRGVIVQWVYDWQDAFSGVTAGFGGATPIEAWPTTVDLVLYPAGTWVRGRGEVISMEGIYDAAQLNVNDFTRLFMEEKFLVRRRCYQSRKFTVPLAVNGATGCCVAVGPDGNVAVETP